MALRPEQPWIQRKCAACGHGGELCPGCEEEGEQGEVQLKEDGTPAFDVPEVEQAVEAEAPPLLVGDEVEELEAGQMRRSEFLAEVRGAVCSASNEVLASVGRSTADCPYLRFIFVFLERRETGYLERTLKGFAPELRGAISARDYIPHIVERVRASTENWVRTGEISGLPPGVPLSFIDAAIGAAPPETAPEPEAGAQFKARGSAPRRGTPGFRGRPRLGKGRPLDVGVRTRFESVFKRDFSDVRVHTGAPAAGASRKAAARALTFGCDVAFAAGEYRPGTLVGDALIAHELAHVLQQRDAKAAGGALSKDTAGSDVLEKDADRSAAGAVASLWAGLGPGLERIASDALPRLSSGLRLQRCKDCNCGSSGPAPSGTTTSPAPSPTPAPASPTWEVVSRPTANPLTPGGQTDEQLAISAFQEICPLATLSGNNITVPTGTVPPNRSEGCDCLLTIERGLSALKTSRPPAKVLVTPYAWSSTASAADPVEVTVRHPDDPFQWGYWTTTTSSQPTEQRYVKPFWQTMAHEVCGHVACYVREGGAHACGRNYPGRASSPRGHDEAIEAENRIAAEHGLAEEQQRGYGTAHGGRPATPHAGESFLASAIQEFDHGSATLPTGAARVIDSIVQTHNRFPVFVELEGDAYANEGGDTLARQRAESVKAELVSRGMGERFHPRGSQPADPQVARYILRPNTIAGTSTAGNPDPNRAVRIYLFHNIRSAGP